MKNFLKLAENYISDNQILKSLEKNFERVIHFKNLVYKWNNKINLTSYSEKEFLIKAVIEPLIIFNSFKPEKEIIDIGTGFGNPSIVLSIVFPEIVVYASEINRKRLSFLHLLKKELKLENLKIIDKYKNHYEIVTCRAFLGLKEFLIFLEENGINFNYLWFFFRKCYKNSDSRLKIFKKVKYSIDKVSYIQILFKNREMK